MEPPSRREQILAAALDLLATTPLERLTTRAIASAVGVTQPALFRHFPSREALLVEVVDAVRAEMERAVSPLLASGGAPLDTCLALAGTLARYVDRKPGLPRLLFADQSREQPELRLALQRLVSMQRALVSGLVESAIRDGSARPDVDPNAAATLFVGMLQAIVVERDLGAHDEGEPVSARVVPVSRLWCAAVAAAAVPRPASGAPTGPTARRGAAVRLDVRPELARGRDPLALVLDAEGGLLPGSLLVVVAPFRPVPLEGLLASRGHAVSVVEGQGGSFELVCVIGGAPEIVDLTLEEPPLPLERVLSLASRLGPDGVLIAHLPRPPRMLLPHLAQRELPHAVVELGDGTALLRVEARA